MCGSGYTGIESAEHLLEVVLSVCWKRIPSSVDTDRCPSRDIVVELDVRGFSQIELHVPVAVRVDGLGQLLAQLDLRERGAIRWEASGGKRAGACL